MVVQILEKYIPSRIVCNVRSSKKLVRSTRMDTKMMCLDRWEQNKNVVRKPENTIYQEGES